MKKEVKLPYAPFERILRDSGANIRVSDRATKAFTRVVEEIAEEVASHAAQFAKHAGRKTITENDRLFIQY